MKFRTKAIAVALAASALVPAAHAQGIGLEATGARAHDRWGGELGVGYAIKVGPLSLRPIAGAFIYEGDNDRYSRETFSNGQERCRDLETGRFANDSNCDNASARWYGKVEAVFAIPLVADVGGGVRLSDERARPYGTVAFALAPRLKLKGNAGDGYYALGVNLGF